MHKVWASSRIVLEYLQHIEADESKIKEGMKYYMERMFEKYGY